MTLPGLKLSEISRIYIGVAQAIAAVLRVGNETRARTLECRAGVAGVIGEIIMRKIFAFTAIAGAILVAACNTVEGAGKDVKSAGETVANVADDAK